MIIYDEEKIKYANDWNDESIIVLADFDRTITAPNSYCSWDIIMKNKNISENYKQEVDQLFYYYRPIEVDETIDINDRKKYMIEWWNKEIELFIKYNFTEETIMETFKNINLIRFRNGFKEFFDNMNKRNIPIIIISAGIGDFIKEFLKNNRCYHENVQIISNFIEFKNKKIIGFRNNLIHSLNKDYIDLPVNVTKLLDLKNKIILFGDSISDINMAKSFKYKEIINIGFLDNKVKESLEYYKKTFDIVATDNTSLNEISKTLKLLKR